MPEPETPARRRHVPLGSDRLSVSSKRGPADIRRRCEGLRAWVAPVYVARQLGHSDPAITLSTYSHLFERARHADEMRAKLGDGFGHLLSARSS